MYGDLIVVDADAGSTVETLRGIPLGAPLLS